MSAGASYYLGRRDFQVKISGYRVELQEIDLVLREAAKTELAVAIPWPLSEGSASGIVGVVSGADPALDAEIISAARRRLPRYMVPTRIYHFAADSAECERQNRPRKDHRDVGELGRVEESNCKSQKSDCRSVKPSI